MKDSWNQSESEDAVIWILVLILVQANLFSQTPDEELFRPYLNFEYSNLGFERQLIGERFFYEITQAYADKSNNLNLRWTPLTGRAYFGGRDGVFEEIDESASIVWDGGDLVLPPAAGTFLTDLGFNGGFYLSNIGWNTKIGFGFGYRTLPDILVEDSDDNQYLISYRNLATTLRADLLFRGWIRTSITRTIADYVISYDDAAEYDAYGIPYIDSGRIEESEYSVRFNPLNAPYASLRNQDLIDSVELHTSIGSNTQINNYGTFLRTNNPYLPYSIIGRNETRDYYYVSGPIKFGLLESAVKVTSETGINEFETGVNLLHFAWIRFDSFSVFRSPTVSDIVGKLDTHDPVLTGFFGPNWFFDFTTESNQFAVKLDLIYIGGSSTRAGMTTSLTAYTDRIVGSTSLFIRF